MEPLLYNTNMQCISVANANPHNVFFSYPGFLTFHIGSVLKIVSFYYFFFKFYVIYETFPICLKLLSPDVFILFCAFSMNLQLLKETILIIPQLLTRNIIIFLIFIEILRQTIRNIYNWSIIDITLEVIWRIWYSSPKQILIRPWK